MVRMIAECCCGPAHSALSSHVAPLLDGQQAADYEDGDQPAATPLASVAARRKQPTYTSAEVNALFAAPTPAEAATVEAAAVKDDSNSAAPLQATNSTINATRPVPRSLAEVLAGKVTVNSTKKQQAGATKAAASPTTKASRSPAPSSSGPRIVGDTLTNKPTTAATDTDAEAAGPAAATATAGSLGARRQNETTVDATASGVSVGLSAMLTDGGPGGVAPPGTSGTVRRWDCGLAVSSTALATNSMILYSIPLLIESCMVTRPTNNAACHLVLPGTHCAPQNGQITNTPLPPDAKFTVISAAEATVARPAANPSNIREPTGAQSKCTVLAAQAAWLTARPHSMLQDPACCRQPKPSAPQTCAMHFVANPLLQSRTPPAVSRRPAPTAARTK